MKKFTTGFVAGLMVTSLSVALAANVRIFSDVDSTSWYSQAVYNLASRGIVSGYPNGTFKPGQPVTRAEVAVMLNKLREDVTEKVENATLPEKSTPPPAAITPPQASSSCAPLTTTTATVVHVRNEPELQNAIKNATAETTILVADGTYTLSKPLWINVGNLIIRSESGNRNSVILKGYGMMSGDVESVFHVLHGNNITIADMTIGWVTAHPIQVHGENNVEAPLLHNLHIVDGKEQLVKVSYDAGAMSNGSDNGILECSTLEYSAGIGPQYYIGGIDAHNAKNWIVRDNIFKAIRSPDDTLAEHAIHFWSSSSGTLVERNTIINSDRGIGFGMGDRGHIGGIIRNNLIYHDETKGDVGIVLENSSNTQVYGNTIFFENGYKNAIEYRFAQSTGISIRDNITNRAISARDGAQATLSSNKTDAAKNEIHLLNTLP